MADILIRGMEMPGNEPLRLVLNQNGQLFVDHGVTFTEYEAVELPPHGDLIDRGAFRAEMDKHYPFDHGTQRKHGEADAAKSTIINMLANSPVIIPADKEETDEQSN